MCKGQKPANRCPQTFHARLVSGSITASYIGNRTSRITMALLGIDYGTAKVGIAIADGAVAVPLRVVRYDAQRELRAALQEVLDAYDIATVVVGMPRRQRNEVEVFIDWLRRELSIPVVTEDEQLTTAFAKRLMREWHGKAEDDAIAAALILQSYIERKHMRHET